MSAQTYSRGPLQEGATVAIVGGGPGGVGCALALKNLSRRMQRPVRVVLFEGKVFAGERQFNQCVGVLSPPIEQLLQEGLGIPFPQHLVQRKINGYMLHSDHRTIFLDSTDPPSFAVRRVQFDEHLLEQARRSGVEIITSRVTDLEFHDDRVVVYSESGAYAADVIVGAFGTDDGTAAVFTRNTRYRPPHCLSSIVTKFHPRPEIMAKFGDRIHAFLPGTSEIEFGAVTPKGNHLTLNIAGARVDAAWMDYFLKTPAVRAVLPELSNAQRSNDLTYFKGRFPTSLARGYSGERYVMVGDASGLVRPFKGKGVNSALLTGRRAAETMMTEGVSAEAWRSYHRACRDISGDLLYGKAMRILAVRLCQFRLLDAVIALAQRDRQLRQALFDSVSAHQSYRAIVRELVRPRQLARLIAAAAGLLKGGLTEQPHEYP